MQKKTSADTPTDNAALWKLEQHRQAFLKKELEEQFQLAFDDSNAPLFVLRVQTKRPALHLQNGELSLEMNVSMPTGAVQGGVIEMLIDALIGMTVRNHEITPLPKPLKSKDWLLAKVGTMWEFDDLERKGIVRNLTNK